MLNHGRSSNCAFFYRQGKIYKTIIIANRTRYVFLPHVY